MQVTMESLAGGAEFARWRTGATRATETGEAAMVPRAAAIALYLAGGLIETFGLGLIAAYGWILAGGLIAAIGLVLGTYGNRRWPSSGPDTWGLAFKGYLARPTRRPSQPEPNRVS